jgi:hypothetical protein
MEGNVNNNMQGRQLVAEAVRVGTGMSGEPPDDIGTIPTDPVEYEGVVSSFDKSKAVQRAKEHGMRVVCSACHRAQCAYLERECARRAREPDLDCDLMPLAALVKLDIEHPAYYSLEMAYGLGALGGRPNKADHFRSVMLKFQAADETQHNARWQSEM